MTNDLPAMRRFKVRLLDAESSPLAMWLSTELAPTFGKGEEWDPFVTLVSAVEAEGSALIGAVPCPRHHGIEDNRGEIGTYDFVADRDALPCPSCGAAL
jgi:hypothetical protein